MKGVTGVGLPLITVPVMAGFLGVERAVLVMVIPSFVLNLVQAWSHRSERFAVPEVPRILVGGMLGASLGASILAWASDATLALALGVWIFAYLLFRFLHPQFRLALPARLRWSPLVGVSAGAMQAATGISAPIIVPYTDALKLQPAQYVYAVCAPFCAFAAAHCMVLAWSGYYATELLWQSALAVLPAVAFVPVGTWLRKFIAPSIFDLLVRALLVVMAIRLIAGAVSF